MAAQPPHEPTWWEPLSEAQLAQLARITLLWSRVEELFDEAASDYLKITGLQWDAIAKNKTLPSKAGLMTGVIGDRTDPFSERFRIIIGLVNDAAPKRNLATHGQWNVEQPSGIVKAQTRGKAGAFEAGDLNPLFQQLKELEMRLVDLTVHVDLNAAFPDPEGWSPPPLTN